MQFESGQSGNPKGARNKATLAAEALLDGKAEAITRKAIDLAKAGDLTAIRLCLERIIPARVIVLQHLHCRKSKPYPMP